MKLQFHCSPVDSVESSKFNSTSFQTVFERRREQSINRHTIPPAILLIDASGAFGRPLVEEFIKNLSKSRKVGILTDPSKVSKFEEVESKQL